MTKSSKILFAYSALAVVLCALTVLLSVWSLGRVDGEIKTAPDAPDTLVSLGAPRSKLDLERMFSAMSKSYLENGRRVFEPMTDEYLSYVAERTARGERVSLSVEEVLFLVTDSVSVYGSYDIIKLADGTRIYPCRDLSKSYLPYDLAAEMRISDIIRLINYRILSASSPDSYNSDGDTVKYIPKNSGGECLLFISPDGIFFHPDAEHSVSLYPSDAHIDDALTAVIALSNKLVSVKEAELLDGAGFSNYRNITPFYWYGRTALRLFVSGGRAIIADADKNTAKYILPEGEKLTSAALSESGMLYITSSSDNGSALWRFDGEAEKIYSSDSVLGAYESPDGYVAAYECDRINGEKYITKLIRRGDPVWQSEN